MATVNYFPAVSTAVINTVSTGLTLSGGVITANLSTGVSGGQSVVGGTAASNNLTLSSTSNVTKGKVLFGSTSYFFDEAVGQLTLGTTSPLSSGTIMHLTKTQNSTTYNLTVNASSGGNAAAALLVATADNLSGSYNGFFKYGSNYTTAGLQAAHVGEVLLAGGSANMLYSVVQAAGDHVFTTTTGRTERFRITSGGNKVCGPAALATNATDGFLYIPTCAGTPNGTPTAYTGQAAIVYDSTNNMLMIYDGAWLGATNPGAWT